MNVYILVEGRRTEKAVYRSWLTSLFDQLKEVQRVEDIKSDQFYILAGNGYPSYRGRIASSVEDIREHGGIDHFLVCIDAEESVVEEKIEEVRQLVIGLQYNTQLHIIVHNCCIETWFLGHRKLVHRSPGGSRLREYIDFYNVVVHDPEKMPKFKEFMTRPQFHFAYLREIFRERRLTYTKRNPAEASSLTYFRELQQRFRETGHIQSFGDLLRVLRTMGAEF